MKMKSFVSKRSEQVFSEKITTSQKDLIFENKMKLKFLYLLLVLLTQINI